MDKKKEAERIKKGQGEDKKRIGKGQENNKNREMIRKG